MPLSDDPVIAINRVKRTAVFEDGSQIAWTDMLDEFGCDTDDSEAAFYAVCQTPDGRWALIYLEAFGREDVN